MNILIYAWDAESSFHKAARQWWDEQLSGESPVCLSWPVINAYLRITTNPRIFPHPNSVEEAAERVSSWLDQPCARIVHATDRHWTVFQDMLIRGKAPANLVADAHLAALAVEHNCVLYSSDADFSRFPTLRWKNPLARAR